MMVRHLYNLQNDPPDESSALAPNSKKGIYL